MLSASECMLRYKVVGLSHPGAVRTENEDVVNWWYEPHYGLTFALVADGMGGHDGGAEASLLASDTLRKRTNSLIRDFSGDIEQLKTIMICALKEANTEIFRAREANETRNKMGTTIVFTAVFNNHLVVLHVGDSRCYLLNRKQSGQNQLTRDDSVVQAMLDEGVITEQDASNVPYRNRLTNALGMQEELDYSLSVRMLGLDDTVLLCSDGFYQAADFAEVTALVGTNGCTQDVAQSLLDMSLNNRTNDNTSLVLIAADADANEVRELNE
jgi:PPM family protein phosphatase